MEIKEAIDILLDTDLTCYGYSKKEVDEAGNMGVEALEKQIPKQVRYLDRDTGCFQCRTCSGVICNTSYDLEDYKYCLICGQKVDWSK